MPQRFRWVLPCPKGCEEVLADELRALDVEVLHERPTAVHARGTLREGYRLCLWSRVASRVLLPLIEVDAENDTALYEALRGIEWWTHFDASQTFAIGSSQAPKSPFPSHYWVQRAKDAIVDSFREHSGERPSVDKRHPALRFHLHIGERHQPTTSISRCLNLAPQLAANRRQASISTPSSPWMAVAVTSGI